MIHITDPRQCSGCTACQSICGHQAIVMQPDKLGFQYPVVDMSKCVDCGLCDKVCPFNDAYDTSSNLDEPIAYAVRHKDMEQVKTSRSGAAFIAFSDYILDKGGIVYGAGFTNHFRVVHKKATTKAERDEFKGSKYVQSDLTGIFPQIKQELRKGRLVLFSGTPCQTAGLNAYVGKQLKANLYLIDLICHGTPSPYIWRDYLAYMEKKYKTTFTKVDFRDKQFGWAAHMETFSNQDMQVTTDTFKYLMYAHVVLRRSCEVCPFTNTRRPSDIMIGDFWGWQKSVPGFNEDDQGCSLVYCNTEKGRAWFNAVANQLTYLPVNVADTLQPNLKTPSVVSPKREALESDYGEKNFGYILHKYGNISLKYKIRTQLRKLKKILK